MENKKRLIDANALIQNHGNDVTNWDNPYAVKVSSIEHAPTVDAVEVVRCKDCKHKDGMPGQPNIICWQMHDDDFCSYGKRKDGD